MEILYYADMRWGPTSWGLRGKEPFTVSGDGPYFQRLRIWMDLVDLCVHFSWLGSSARSWPWDCGAMFGRFPQRMIFPRFGNLFNLERKSRLVWTDSTNGFKTARKKTSFWAGIKLTVSPAAFSWSTWVNSVYWVIIQAFELKHSWTRYST